MMASRTALILLLATLPLTAAACSDAKPPEQLAKSVPMPAPAPPAEAQPGTEPGAPPFRIVEHPRTPTARTPDDCTVLELDREQHTLRYRRGSAPSCPSFERSTALLHEMVTAFDALGDLPSVTSFMVGREYPLFFERLALAASHSDDWDAKRGMPDEGGPSANNAFVVKLAHDPAAFFPEMLAILQGTPLRPELRSVEKVLVLPAKATPLAAALAKHGVAPEAKLPFDCIVGFSLTREAPAH